MRENLCATFRSFDSTELFMRFWPPRDQNSKKALILLHRGHEHSGRLNDLAEYLNLENFWMFSFDFRGHGQSPGPRGYAPDFSTLVKDLDQFVSHIVSNYHIPIENIAVVANSVGAVVAATWVHDYAPQIRAMVLAAPAFKVKLYVPLALPGLRILNKIKHPAFISSYVKSRMLTHDVEESKKYDEDPLIARQIAVNILIGLFDASQRVLENAAHIDVPTFVMSAGRDFVVHTSPQRTFFDRINSKIKKYKVYSKFFHGILYEKERIEAISDIQRFILETYTKQTDRSYLLRSDRQGYSYDRYKALATPLQGLSALYWGFQKWMLRLIGRLSEGIQVGLKYGFDSGISLDYIYQNQVRGKSFLGRIIDSLYANAIGWRGIRQRKINLENFIERVVEEYSAKNLPLNIVDVAGGPGRYLLEIALKHREKDLHITICDNSQENIEQGKKIAQDLGLKNVTYQIADAFSNPAVQGANLIVVSGLYELFSDNVLVQESLRKISERCAPSAYILYTGQAWHPQQKIIARTLTNREGKPWIMRLRSQAELDSLAAAPGFKKIETLIDPYGIFTVSLAQRVSTISKPKTYPTPYQELTN